MKTFDALNVSSKFAICGLPIRVDTYKSCSFGCKYCFSNNRVIMEFEKKLQVGNIEQLRKRLVRVLIKRDFKSDNLLDNLISQGITWHCGGMSDPFQPIEKELKITEKLIDITNEFGISVLFSTKSNTYYGAKPNPKLHTFQLSITNIDDRKDIEPNVPSIESRYNFYRKLKQDGFKVGIRLQPFIPNITTLDIVKKFYDADHFVLEGIKIVPQNNEHKEYIFNHLGLDKNDFTQMGLLNLKPMKRLEAYKPFIDFFEENHISYSIADNDLHFMGNNKCCCGDALIHRGTDFNNTVLLHEIGKGYTKSDVMARIKNCGLDGCRANHLFTSNRQEGCVTIKDFYDKRFDRAGSPFSPKFQYDKDIEPISLFDYDNEIDAED